MAATPDRAERRELVRRHIDRSIVLKVRIYSVIALVALLIMIVEIFMSSAAAWWGCLIGLAGGVGIGMLASRMQKLSWNAFESKVVAAFDAVGVVVLIGYIVFAVFRTRIVAAWFPADIVAPVGMAVLAGLMIGQILGIGNGLRRLARTAGGRSDPDDLKQA